jgi:hypothetical protein
MDPSKFYLPSAIALGALHALEPGHAKTVTAAYLIGTKGTKGDAVILGLSVAFTHSIVVILLAVIGVWVGTEAFAEDAMYWLQFASSCIVILLGCYLLYRRWPQGRLQPHQHDHGHPETHHHAPEPFRFSADGATGTLAVVDTPEGERFRLELTSHESLSGATARIMRPHNVVEEHVLVRQADGTWLVAVVVWGKTGRMPKIGPDGLTETGAESGRSHWTQAGFALVMGGGLKMGQVIGATEPLARYPTTAPYTPQNVLATLYHVLGIDPETTMIHDPEGRPMHLLEDRKPVKELL